MSEESENTTEDATPAFFEDADAPDQEKEEFRRLDARERPTASQEGAPDTTTAAANASIHRGSRYEGGTDELTADIGAPTADQGNVEFEPPAAPSDRPGDDTTPVTRNRSSQPVDGDPTAPTEDEDGDGATTRTTIERPDQPVPSEAGATAPAPRESAVNAAAAGENQDEQPALTGSPLPSQSLPGAAADDAEFTPVAQAPAVVFSGTTGNEDEAISLDLGVALTDTDGNETLSITISGVPEGAQLSGGTDNGDGTWTLAPADLPGLTLTPPENFSGTISLGVTATATETTGQTAATTATADITVQAIADTPAIETTDTAGNEDTAIALDVQSALTDTDGSETLSIRIRNIPNGSQLTLADGTEVTIIGGTATLTPDQLSGLSLTPPADFAGEIDLEIVATSTDGTDMATTSGTLNVSVTAIADAPTLEVTDAAGAEDQAIALDIQSALTDTDGSETLSVSISNIPDGAVLTLSDGTVVPVTGGTATLTPDQLSGLNLTPPADFAGEIALDVTATSTDGTDMATTSGTLNVSVTATADAPTLDLTDAAGAEDQAIALNIDAALTDAGETLSVTIGNIPEGSVLTLSDGTVVPVTGGTATLTPDQLAGLNLTSPADFSGEIALEVVATSTDGTDTATTSGTLNVSVTAVADAPVLNVADATGLEDQAIALNIDAALTDAGETLSVTIGNIPDGAVLTLADGSTVTIAGGTATLTPDQLAGLNLTPPADFSGDIALSITATSTDGTDTATTSGTLNVSVTAAADAPVLNVADAAGLEDQAIALNIDAALTDAGETL
ncbi:MAG: calcium-binding protein, partial [Rhodospirillales bacterium]